MQLFYYERDDAEYAAQLLSAAGFTSRTVRDRFAGEDVPWALVTDAPTGELAAFAEAVERDDLGWVETD